MKKLAILTLFIVIGSNLTGCNCAQRQDAGMILGGVMGGFAGSALTGGSAVGTIAGAVGGGYVGRQVSR